jgi:hypothetical protein
MIANDNFEPYERGRRDFEANVPRECNPYDYADYGTTFWEAWFEGWDDASNERPKMNQPEK